MRTLQEKLEFDCGFTIGKWHNVTLRRKGFTRPAKALISPRGAVTVAVHATIFEDMRGTVAYRIRKDRWVYLGPVRPAFKEDEFQLDETAPVVDL